MSNNFKKEYNSANDSSYYFSAGKIGATASPQTPNQIGELTSRLNQGLKAVEIGAMNQRLMDQIPLDHFKEIKRMNILTGAEATLHAPIQDMDLTGFTQQGWNENERKGSVNQLKSVIDRAHLMDIKGNIPITIHAGSSPLQKWQREQYGGVEKDGYIDYTVDENTKKLPDQKSEMVIVNRDTGQMQLVKYDEKTYITGEKQAWTPERRLNNLNRTSWDQEQLQLMQMKKDFIEVEDRFKKSEQRYYELLAGAQKKLLTENEKRELAQIEDEKQRVRQYGDEIYTNIRSAAEEMYNRYNKFKPEIATTQDEEREKKFKENMKLISKEEGEVERLHEELFKLDKKAKSMEPGKEREKVVTELNEKYERLTDKRNQQTDLIVKNFQNMPSPKTWMAADDFSKEKVSDSIAEAALYGYKKYKEDAPILSMENVYPEFGLSRAESLKETIEESRKKFTKILIEKENLSKKKAEEVAEKLIGVTWDVGHIYMLRKHGYTDEDIKKEAKKIAPLVKHIHLTDNFGFEDSHLPPGEGAVNIEEQLEEIRAGIKKKFSEEGWEKVKSIVEAGEFVANFKEAPHMYALSNLNSPLYAEDNAPYWSQWWDSSGNYMTGFGEMMPQKYFDLYGAPGFGQLPRELGGSGKPAERGRLASSEET